MSPAENLPDDGAVAGGTASLTLRYKGAGQPLTLPRGRMMQGGPNQRYAMQFSRADRLLLLAVAAATFMLMGAVQAIYGPALAGLSREEGLSLAAVSSLISVHWVGCFAGVALMYLLGDRVMPRLLLLVLAAGAALLGWGASWEMTLAGAALTGLGQGCVSVLLNPRILAVFGPRGPAMLSLMHAGFGLGAIVAPLVFVVLDGAFRPIWLALAVVLLGVAAIARDTGRVAAETKTAGFRPDWAILGFGVVGIALEAVLIGLGPAALVRAGSTESEAAQWLSGFFVAFLGFRIVLIFAAHLIAPFRLYTLSVGGIAVCMAGALVTGPGWWFVLAGGFAGMIFPGYFVEAIARMGHDPRVSPLVVAAGLMGGIFAPPLLAGLVQGMGPRGFFVLVAGLSAGVLLAALLRLMQRNAYRQGA